MELKKINPQSFDYLRVNNCSEPAFVNCKAKVRKKQYRKPEAVKMLGVNWIPGSGTKGSADIAATVKGRSVKVEIKYGKDKQSEAQKQYQRNIEAAGGLYFIAKDFDDTF